MIKVMYLRESKQQWTAVARLQRAGSSEHRSWLWGGVNNPGVPVA